MKIEELNLLIFWNWRMESALFYFQPRYWDIANLSSYMSHVTRSNDQYLSSYGKLSKAGKLWGLLTGGPTYFVMSQEPTKLPKGQIWVLREMSTHIRVQKICGTEETGSCWGRFWKWGTMAWNLRYFTYILHSFAFLIILCKIFHGNINNSLYLAAEKAGLQKVPKVERYSCQWWWKVIKEELLPMPP